MRFSYRHILWLTLVRVGSTLWLGALVMGLSAPCGSVHGVVCILNTCHDATLFLISPTRPYENSSHHGYSKACDRLFRMTIALKIANQKAIPGKHGAGVCSIGLCSTPGSCNFTCAGRATPCTLRSDWACQGRDLHNYEKFFRSNKCWALNATRRGCCDTSSYSV